MSKAGLRKSRMIVNGHRDQTFLSMGATQALAHGNHSVMSHYLSGVSHIDGKICGKDQLIEEDGFELDNLKFGDDTVTLTARQELGATATEYNWDVPMEIYNSLPLDGLPSVEKTRH